MKRVNIYSVKLVKESGKLYDIDREMSKITSPAAAVNIINAVFDMENLPKEHFVMLCLDSKNKITGAHVVHVGALNMSVVHPREVFQLAILNNSAGIIVAHNHPSGDVTPSPEDIQLTKRLYQAGQVLGINVLDHVIIGDGRFTSLKERGIL